jgi:PEP-CTERM motif-containing protein
METGSYLYPYTGMGSYRNYFLHTDPNDGSRVGVGWTDNGILIMETSQAVGNWNQAWTPQSTDSGSVYYDNDAAAFFAAKSTAISGVYVTEPDQGAEGVTFITRGGRDYLIDSAREGGLNDMDPPSLVDLDNYTPDQYESGGFDPAGMYVSNTPVSDFGIDLDTVATGDQTTAYFMPRDMVEVAGELYGITYKFGPNNINDIYCKTSKATVIKLDTVMTGDTATSVIAHADMMNPSSPWEHGIQMWDTTETGVTGCNEIQTLTTDGTNIFYAADSLEDPAGTATYDESNGIYTTTTTGVPIFRCDVDTAQVSEIGRFYSDPSLTSGTRLESYGIAISGNALAIADHKNAILGVCDLDTSGNIDTSSWDYYDAATLTAGLDQTVWGNADIDICGIDFSTDANDNITGMWVSLYGGDGDPDVSPGIGTKEERKTAIVYLELEDPWEGWPPNGMITTAVLASVTGHWQQYVTGGPWEGDMNGDGFVSTADLAYICGHWFRVTAVPEPSTIIMLILGAISLLVLRRR